MIALPGGELGWGVAVTGIAAQLAAINLGLAVFNLLPGFPLDGGRRAPPSGSGPATCDGRSKMDEDELKRAVQRKP